MTTEFLREQIKAAFDLSNEALDKAIELAREAVKEPGRELEREIWESATRERYVSLCLSRVVIRTWFLAPSTS